MTHQKYTAEQVAAREKLLNEAVAAGKFMASRRQHYSDLFDASPEVARQTIARLFAIPEVSDTRLATAPDLAAGPAYNAGMLSISERRRLDATQRGNWPTISME
jgi:hypothetical protein